MELESVEGHPYRSWEWCRMPRIADKYLNCVVYLYPTVAAAKRGQGYGGSGFVVKVMSHFSDAKKRHFYVVSNSHVVQSGSTVIRFNRKDGSVATVQTSKGNWTYSESADLAVFPIELDDSYDVYPFNDNKFLRKGKVVTKGLGIGDETFVLGRFINHEGKQRNRPTARFGTVAMMPDANDGIYNEHMSQHQEAYLVETHTICGYSGSPVFFYIPAFSVRPEHDAAQNPLAWRGPWLLGVDFAHIINHEPVQKLVNGRWEEQKDMQVAVTTGMMCVSPAWHLDDLLKDAGLKADREAKEAIWQAEEPAST